MTAIEEMSRERLESEITELAAHINAAKCRWLALVAEFDRRQGWAEWGAKSCAHWLSVRCGLALGAAREQVRVASRLAELPCIRARFERGELSFSQVRAMTRVATPELEEELLRIASYASGAQLETVVRSYRGVLANELGEERHRARYVEHAFDENGSLIIKARLAPDEGAVVLAALEAARDGLREKAAATFPRKRPRLPRRTPWH